MRLCIAVYSYTRNFAYIYVYTRMSSFHTYSNIVLYVSFSKYVSTLFLYVHTVDYQTTSVQIVHRLSNDVEIWWFFLRFIVLTLSLNLNTLYLTIRRYDVSSLFVTYRPLSHSTLTHRLPLRLTEPTVTQFVAITYQNFHHSPARCTHPINRQSPYCRPTNENTDI